MGSIKLRYRENGALYIPQFKYIPDASDEDQKEREWKDFEYGKHIHEDSYPARVGQCLGDMKEPRRSRFTNATWFFKTKNKDDKQTIYFHNRILAATWLACVQECYRDHVVQEFKFDIEDHA